MDLSRIFNGLPWPPQFFIPGCYCCGGDFLYLYCGTVDNDAYDVAGDSWTSKTNVPAPTRNQPSYGAAIGSAMYAFGGNGTGGPFQDTDEYTPDSWTAKTDMPTPGRFSFPAAVISGAAYCYGGSDAVSATYLNDNDEYVPDTWTSKTDLPAPDRVNPAGSPADGKAYCMFGVASPIVPGTYLQDNDEYNPGGDSWSAKTDGPTPARTGSRSFSIDDLIYCVGGRDSGGTLLADNDEYDSAGDAWTARTDANSARSLGSGTTTSTGYGFYIGGLVAARENDQYDPVGDSWTDKSLYPTPARTGTCGATL